MRTTVNIPEDLLAEAKAAALRERVSLGSVVEEALRRHLAAAVAAPVGLELPTYGGSGLREGVDLEDKEAMAELLDASS